jgi:hypothetical protein
MPTSVKEREEELTEDDKLARPTLTDAEFWPACDPHQLTLSGDPKVFPAGTHVVAVCRLQGRLLLEAPGKFYKWADPSFRFTAKKK